MEVIKLNTRFFNCVQVSREDLVASFEDLGLDEIFINQLSNLDDEIMGKIAREIGETLMIGGDYWDACRRLSLQYLKECSSYPCADEEALKHLNNVI